ncbi:MAG TPA: peroxiredoxin-like family protein [Solirubrobacteraceae bacterium]|nr:peroxiredoxin-like family protein [Solirubrobacteraceae bacterium]
MDRAREQFDQAGLDLVLIGQATPRHAAHFRRRHELSLPILADEERESYKAAGLKVGGVGDLLGPKSVAKGALTMLRTGKVQGRVIGNASQLGGAMVIGPGGEVLFKQMAKDASDNASPQELLAAL